MAYIKRKKIKGRIYLYLAESYREAGKVKTRTLEYLGPENGANANPGKPPAAPPLTKIEKASIGKLRDLFGDVIQFRGPDRKRIRKTR